MGVAPASLRGESDRASDATMCVQRCARCGWQVDPDERLSECDRCGASLEPQAEPPAPIAVNEARSP